MKCATVLMSFLLAAMRVETAVVRARFAAVKCWTAVLSLVAASAKLSSKPVRASITSAVAGGMMLLAALVNGSPVAPACWRLMPQVYAAK